MIIVTILWQFHELLMLFIIHRIYENKEEAT